MGSRAATVMHQARNRLDADPDKAARALGFPFRDMTRTARFTLTNRIMYEEMRPRPEDGR